MAKNKKAIGISVTHKGYTLVQSGYSTHYAIFENATKRFVMHSQYTKRLTEETAKEHIENFIKFTGRADNENL